MRARASGRYTKVDAAIEGTVLCCTLRKGGPSFVLRANDVAELVVSLTLALTLTLPLALALTLTLNPKP